MQKLRLSVPQVTSDVIAPLDEGIKDRRAGDTGCGLITKSAAIKKKYSFYLVGSVIKFCLVFIFDTLLGKLRTTQTRFLQVGSPCWLKLFERTGTDLTMKERGKRKDRVVGEHGEQVSRCRIRK